MSVGTDLGEKTTADRTAGLTTRRIYWNSKIAQQPPTVGYKGIMSAEGAQGGKSISDCLDKVVRDTA